MKYTCIIVFVLLIGMLSCRKGNEPLQTLFAKVEHVMEQRPDSALALLEQVSLSDCRTAGDSARYALLFTQAQDKNYISHTSDSLIRIAVHYYEASSDLEKKALAYFYLASVYRDMRKHTEAVKGFLRSLSYAEMDHDLQFEGMIYNNIAFLFYEQDIYDSADSIYQIMSGISLELKDTVMYGESLLQRGKVLMEKKIMTRPTACSGRYMLWQKTCQRMDGCCGVPYFT